MSTTGTSLPTIEEMANRFSVWIGFSVTATQQMIEEMHLNSDIKLKDVYRLCRISLLFVNPTEAFKSIHRSVAIENAGRLFQQKQIDKIVAFVVNQYLVNNRKPLYARMVNNIPWPKGPVVEGYHVSYVYPEVSNLGDKGIQKLKEVAMAV